MLSSFQYRSLSHRWKLLCRMVFDIISIILVASGIFAIRFGAQPFHRGFFCDDESIQHPVLSDTIPMPLAASIGVLLPSLLIFVLEFSLRENDRACIISVKKSNTRNNSWIGAIYNTMAVFIFGMAVTQFLTEVGKYSVGRLRPHFLTLCDPDMTKLNCSAGYITEVECTSSDAFKMKDARLSFPSGHSSFSMYCSLFLILYIQARISCEAVVLMKPVLQLIFFSMGFYTCLSRISDYKHHWSDVLCGAFLGMTVCVCVISSLADFSQNLWTRDTIHATENESLIPSASKSNERESEEQYYDRS